MIALAVSVACRSSVEAVVQATMQQPQHSPAQAAGRGTQNEADQGLVPKLMAWAGTPAGEQLVMKVVSVFTRQVGSARSLALLTFFFSLCAVMAWLA